jgi:SAM-dependent methyltransferase
MLINYLKEILRGKDLYRILMNQECANYELKGLVLDVGSGAGASYNRFFKKQPGVKLVPLDLKTGIDLEKDKLPYGDASVDMVLAFNLLEHIYNYRHLLLEIKRVLKPGGRVLGAVPFLVGYHPDPRDFWRYTSETLEKIFKENGFSGVAVKLLGWGPVAAAFSQVEFLCPRIFKIFILPIVLLKDWAILKIKPSLTDKYPLGFFFIFNG